MGRLMVAFVVASWLLAACAANDENTDNADNAGESSPSTMSPEPSSSAPEIGSTGLTSRQLFDPNTKISLEQFRTLLAEGDDLALWYVHTQAWDQLDTDGSLASAQLLAPHTQTVFGAVDIWAEVGNGGLPQYFFNGYHRRWPVQRDALLRLEQDDIVAATDAAFELVEQSDIDVTDPNASMDDLIDVYATGAFDRFDEAFFVDGSDPIYEALLAYVGANLEAIHGEVVG